MSEEAVTTKGFFASKKSQYINIIVMLCIMIFFRFIPPFGAMTKEGMAVLGVFLGTVYGWLTIPSIAFGSVAGMIMMGTTFLYDGVGASVSAAMGNQNVVMIMMCFAVSAVMGDSGASDYLAKKIISAKIGRNNSTLLLFLFAVAGIIVSPFAGLAFVFLMWDLWRSVCEQGGASEGFKKFGISTIMVSVCLANQCYPFTAGIIVFDGVWNSVSGLPAAPFVNFLVYMLSMTFVITILFIIAGKYLLKIKFMDASNVEIQPTKATPYMKFVLCEVLAMIVLMALSSFNLGPVSAYLKTWGLTGLALAVIVVNVFVNPKGSTPTIQGLMSKYVSWDLLFTMGMVMMLAMNMSNEEIGLGATIQGALSFLTNLGPAPFVLIICLIPLVVTQYLSNMTMGVIFIALGYTFGTKLGLNTYALNCSFYCLTCAALASPAGSLGASMYYGQPEIDKGTGAKHGWVFVVLTYVVCLIWYFLFGNLFFPASLLG